MQLSDQDIIALLQTHFPPVEMPPETSGRIWRRIVWRIRWLRLAQWLHLPGWLSSTAGNVGDDAENVVIGKHNRQTVDRGANQYNFSGGNRSEPESLSNREIFERLFRLESDAKTDRFRIQVGMVCLAVLIIALVAALWFAMFSKLHGIEQRSGRIENRMNGIENRLNSLFPDEFPDRYPPFYGSFSEVQN